MYIPKQYNSDDKLQAVAFMKQFNFATIVTSNEEHPIATHLPFVVSEEEDTIILTAHFAKANEQWKEIESKKVLIIFTEPHAYISPKHYNKKQNVPTWNYVAVHAYGKASIVSYQQEVFTILEDLMDVLEPSYKKQWDGLSQEYKTGMANGIVAFKVRINDLQFKKKLSQNKKENERKNIIDSFSKSDNQNEQLIAKYMKSKK